MIKDIYKLSQRMVIQELYENSSNRILRRRKKKKDKKNKKKEKRRKFLVKIFSFFWKIFNFVFFKTIKLIFYCFKRIDLYDYFFSNLEKKVKGNLKRFEQRKKKKVLTESEKKQIEWELAVAGKTKVWKWIIW